MQMQMCAWKSQEKIWSSERSPRRCDCMFYPQNGEAGAKKFRTWDIYKISVL